MDIDDDNEVDALEVYGGSGLDDDDDNDQGSSSSMMMMTGVQSSRVEKGVEWEQMWSPAFRSKGVCEIAALCMCNILTQEGNSPKGITTTPIIHNMVCVCKVYTDLNGGQINLNDLAELLPNSSYNKHIFAAITLRISNPNYTSLLFTSGKFRP